MGVIGPLMGLSINKHSMFRWYETLNLENELIPEVVLFNMQDKEIPPVFIRWCSSLRHYASDITTLETHTITRRISESFLVH